MSRAWWCLVAALVAWPGHRVSGAGADDDAGDDVVLRAMKDELPRAMKLKLADVEVPYYVAYRVDDVDALRVEASLGALVSSSRDRGRSLRVSLRVGGHDFDNSNFSDSRSFMGGGRPEALPVEDDYDALRWELWLASDDAYKAAAEDLEKKRAALASRTAPKDEVADFSTESPASVVGPVRDVAVDAAAWEDMARTVSEVFSSRPAIYESAVSISIRTTTRRFASTEGTASRDQRTVARIDITAATQADDGMRLEHYASFAAADPKELPARAELVAAANGIADELVAMRDAPVVESYTGPVLFEGRAAAQVVRSSLAGNLVGTPPPESERPGMNRRMGLSDTALAGRIGKRVASRRLSVVDDPTTDSARGLPLVGAYAFDAEGVPGQRVALIDRGTLETFLMSRTPREDLDKSNGHARGGAFGPVRAQIGNLIVSVRGGKSTRQLEAELVRGAKREGYDYGLVVTLLDDPAITGMERDERMEMFMAASRGGDPAPPPPLVAYKVTGPGRRQLVRGAMLGPIRVRQWRDAVGGKRYAVHSFGVTGLGGAFAMMAGAGGEPASIVAPELLFADVEVKAAKGGKTKPPIVPSPLASGD